MLILAVDDDPDDLELFCDALREIDHSINTITASNGEEALDYLHRKAIAFPDLVFLDINMPRVDGRECLRAIRNHKETRKLDVIIHSTSLSEKDTILFHELKAQFLSKASCYGDLVSSLRVIIAQLKERASQPTSLKGLELLR